MYCLGICLLAKTGLHEELSAFHGPPYVAPALGVACGDVVVVKVGVSMYFKTNGRRRIDAATDSAFFLAEGIAVNPSCVVLRTSRYSDTVTSAVSRDDM